MGREKRKADAASAEAQSPSKKPATAGMVRVRHVRGPDVAKPVVAFSPGLALPPNLTFKSYSKSTDAGAAELLLQSSDHATVDYLATESHLTDAAERHLKHYVAVFDPSTNKLHVTEAKRMTVRSTIRHHLRPSAANGVDDQAEEIQPVSNYSSRAALTAAFGTKKSKKAVQSIAENRLLARGGDDDGAGDPVSSAILASVHDDDVIDNPVSTAESLASKPLPKPDLAATEIRDFYPLSSLVHPGPPHTTLAQMPTAAWLSPSAAEHGITTRSRFVANRVAYLTRALAASPDDTFLRTAVQTLSYLGLLLEVHKFVSRLSPRRPIPQPESWPPDTLSDTYADSLSSRTLGRLVSAFFPIRLPTTHALTLLRTTILALALQVPSPTLSPAPALLATETSDVGFDLALAPTEVAKLYRELGCRLETLTETELAKLGWTAVTARPDPDGDGDSKAVKVKFAKLRFPVEFPKVSRGRAPAARR